MKTSFKKKLSASTGGKRISVIETATLGDAIHTGPSIEGQMDEVFLYADNNSASAVVLSIEFGGIVEPIAVTVAANSSGVLVTPGLILEGASTPLTITAFAATTAVINIGGYVNHLVD